MSESTINNDVPSTAVAHDMAHDITQMIEHHDFVLAVGKLHDASHAMNDKQFHELLVQVSQQNEADRKSDTGLPIVRLTTANGVEGLQIDDAKRSITFCEGEDKPAAKTKDDAKDSHSFDPPKGSEGLFYFYDEVSKPSVLKLTQDMESWAKNPLNKDQPIRIVMNSPGGSVFDGFSLMDEIAHLRREGHRVNIEDYGMAASAAGWIMQAADTRSIGANSWMLIHEPSSETSGKLSSIETDLHFGEQLENQFLQVFADRSKLSVEEIRKHIDGGRDWWIPAKTAKTLGLVDQVEDVPVYQPEKPHHS